MTLLQVLVFFGIWFLPCALMGLLRCRVQVWFKKIDQKCCSTYCIHTLHQTMTHCILHKHALVSKILPSSLADVLKIGVAMVNYGRGRAFNHRIFLRLSKEMDSKFKLFLYHIEVRWLSWEKVMNHVFALRAELLEFLKIHNHRH